MVSEEPTIHAVAVPSLIRGLVDADEYLTASDPEARTTLWLRDVTEYMRKEVARSRADAG